QAFAVGVVGIEGARAGGRLRALRAGQLGEGFGLEPDGAEVQLQPHVPLAVALGVEGAPDRWRYRLSWSRRLFGRTPGRECQGARASALTLAAAAVLGRPELDTRPDDLGAVRAPAEPLDG